MCYQAGVDLVQLQAFDLIRRRFQRMPALALQLMHWICPIDTAEAAQSGGSQTGIAVSECLPSFRSL